MSETKTAFAERTIRSLINILYRYLEDNGYKYIHNLNQFVLTLTPRRNCSIDLITKNVKSSDFCPVCASNHYENLINQSLKLEIDFASPIMAEPSGRVVSHSLHERYPKFNNFF